MKIHESRRLFYSLFVLGILFLLAGCQKSGLQEPDFPLKEADIITALAQTNLPGTISDDKTILSEEYTSYVLDSADQRLPVAIIFSSNYEGKRFLSLTFISPPTSKDCVFLWEDWKQQLALAALLYGGFTDEDEIYRGFFEQEVSDGELEVNENNFDHLIAEQYEWDAEFSAGYCRVYYKLVNSSIETDPFGSENFNVVEQTPHMTISIYESVERYNERLQKQLERDQLSGT
ncbi:hypothetical protein [uncultured Dysosmobacter sp.]|uniref:hypothetical protein n=1 Tax=uncultured Dysosmobacter sp. TaxID=2591384 RepID=UPI002624637A|nr:hypothetical protein [uncultured Dysosmobacter sp.]